MTSDENKYSYSVLKLLDFKLDKKLEYNHNIYIRIHLQKNHL